MPARLPVIHEKDGGMQGKGCDFQYTCYTCRHGRRCIYRLKITTETSTECKFEPPRFVPHPSTPLVWPEQPKKRRGWRKPQFEQPEEIFKQMPEKKMP
jgi:hypothetical protein